ncbi:MAG TPA: acyltransferase family protein, partial [Hyphomicrobiaceae bacterium]|nr:acyltransferase family protein [Hyphomicrobiaceae bacterium]
MELESGSATSPSRLSATLLPCGLGRMLTNSFGVLRLIAALVVVLSHSYGLVYAAGTQEPLFEVTGFNLGQHAVHVFFVLSGLLVTASLMKSASIPAYL